jgi:hypothetical protein
MQKISSQSGFFYPRILLGFGLCFVGMLLAVFSFAATPLRQPSKTVALNKIAPWVLEHTAGGKQA